MLLLNNSQQWPPKSYKQDIYKNIFRSFDRSLCPTGRMPQLFCVFMHQGGGHGGNKISVHSLTVFSTLFVEWFLLCWISVRTGKHPYILLANLVMLMLWNVWYPILWLMSREETSMEKHLTRYMNNDKNTSLCMMLPVKIIFRLNFFSLGWFSTSFVS